MRAPSMIECLFQGTTWVLPPRMNRHAQSGGNNL
jgi:hypothetical protein